MATLNTTFYCPFMIILLTISLQFSLRYHSQLVAEAMRRQDARKLPQIYRKLKYSEVGYEFLRLNIPVEVKYLFKLCSAKNVKYDPGIWYCF